MLRVQIDWTNLPGGNATSVLHFTGTTQPQAEAVADAVQIWLGNIKAGILAGVVAQVNPVIIDVDPATNENINYFNVDTSPQVGSLAGEPLPQSSMMLHQLKTGVVRNGRLLQGRFFLPGLTTAASANGEVSSTYRTNYAIEMGALISAGLEVYGRPTAAGGDGIQAAVQTVTIWNEWANLGKRRK